MNQRVLIFSKKKKRTRFAHSLGAALQRRGDLVKILNLNRLRRIAGERAAYRRAISVFESFAPDLVFVYSKDVTPEVLSHIAPRVPCVVFSEDLGVPIDPRLVELARLGHVFLITNRTQAREVVELGVDRSYFIRGAVDPELHVRFLGSVPPRYRSDIAFIGRPGDQERHDLLQRLSRRFDVRIYGSKDWKKLTGLQSWKTDVFPRDYARICAGAKVVVGLDARHDFECYCSNRTWLTLGCGGFLVTSCSPGMEEVVKPGEHALLYKSHEECEEMVAKYLELPDERHRIADAGYRYVLENRTFDHFAVEMKWAVEGKKLPLNLEAPTPFPDVPAATQVVTKPS